MMDDTIAIALFLAVMITCFSIAGMLDMGIEDACVAAWQSANEVVG